MRNRIMFGLLILSVVLSCKSKDSPRDYIGNWLEVKQKSNEFVIIDCGYDGMSLKIDNDSIFEKGIMEDVNLKIDHIKQDESGTTLFIDKLEKSYYKFSWIDKENSISKWEIKYDESPIVINFFINKIKSNKIKTVKGSKLDCISTEDVGDIVNDSLIISDKSVLLIEDDNCISIKNSKSDFVFERCFDNSIIKIRHVDTNGLPLTIINGKNSMDIDFIKKGNEWISNSITYYSGPLNGEKKIKQIVVSLREFDFSSVADQFND